MGGALVRALLEDGVEVTVLARGSAGAGRLADDGARVVRGDIGEVGRWEARVADAEVVFHVGLPRMVPPVRRRHLGRAEREARAGAEVMLHVAAGRPLVMASCALQGTAGPLDIARPARAAEQVLAGSDARIVRLPWAYGPSGFLCDISRGLQMRRFRMVGPADNRIAVVSARDAAAALRAAVHAPPGTYAVAEPVAPTQEDLVALMCRERGATRPDHLPPLMARMSMGSVVVQAITADQRVDEALPPGFACTDRWDRDMMDALGGH